MDLEIICKKVCDLSLDVGIFIQSELNKLRQGDIQTKSFNNFVTYVDMASEKKLTGELSNIIPEAGFIVEENTISKKGKRLQWVIDPLDGTTNYIHSLPIFSISIALLDDNDTILGVVYEINSKECFYAWKGSQAFMNKKTIHVSPVLSLKESLLATGFPYYDYGKMEAYLHLLKYLMRNSHGIRRLGSAAIDLAYVACGRFEGFYEYGLNPWDVAAGAFIVQRAGGQICDFKGGMDYLYGNEIIATNGLIHNEMLKAIGNYFK
jgi:myo-inositol-1(or 4)-monophosphatase